MKIKKIWMILAGIYFLAISIIYFAKQIRTDSLDWARLSVIFVLFASILLLVIRKRKIDKIHAKLLLSRHENYEFYKNQVDNTDHAGNTGDTGDIGNTDNTDNMNLNDNINHTSYSNNDAVREARLTQMIEQECKNNPLIGAQFGANDIWHMLMTAFQEPDGRINAKTLLLWASGLAGYACQASAWEKAALDGKMPEELYAVQTKDGKIFYMGDGINKPLLSNQYSIWNLAAGIYRKLEPDKPLPDIEKLVGKSASTLGDKNYKIWGEINPYHMAEEYGQVWKHVRKRVTAYCKNPDDWSLLFGLVLQKALEMTIKVTPPEQNCLEMAMENALFTSKMDMHHYLSQ